MSAQSSGKVDPRLTTRLDVPRLPDDLLARAAALPASTLHEAAGKIGVLPPAIQGISSSFRVCGPALTVHSPPGDNLWLHRALAIAQPGDVMVVYTSGVHEHGYWGEIMATAAQACGLAGLVIDACVRDVTLLQEMGFPVFARGACMRGTGKDFGATGFINHPVLMGDVSVSAGDLIVGDADGVVAIPHAQVATVLDAAAAREAKEAAIMAKLRAGGVTTLSLYGWD